MNVLKKLFFFISFLILFPIVCFAANINKPHLVFKVNFESLILDNSNIKSAHLVKNDDESYHLNIVLTSKAAKQLANISAANIGKKMSLFYGDDKLISEVTIQGSLGSELQISRFPENEGKKIIDSLKK